MRAAVRTHGPVAGVTVAYAILLALVAWWPRHVDAGLGVVGWPLTRTLADALGTDPQRIAGLGQIGANVVLFVPLGVLIARVRPERATATALAGGLVLSATIEVVQWAVLSGRTASWADVAANALGALGGAVVVAATPQRTVARSIWIGGVAAVVVTVFGVLVWGLTTAGG